MQNWLERGSEPRLEELLRDEVLLAVLRRDRLSIEAVRHATDRAEAALRRREPAAKAA